VSNSLDEMYDYERWAFNLIYLTLGILILGISLGEIGIENSLTDLINQNFLNPIFNESAGDAGYNTVNTMVYALVLSMFVVALSAWLRSLGIDGSDMTIIALFPFVFWAATGEVVEDARMLNDVLAPYFVSPGIHFQTAFWVIVAGFFSYRIAHSTSIDEDDKIERVNSAATLLVLTQFLLYSWSIQEGAASREIGLLPLAFFGLMAVFLPNILGNSLNNFTLVQRGVYIVGLGGTMIFLGALLSYAASVSVTQLFLWPLAVVIGFPAILIWQMHKFGIESAMSLRAAGMDAGILKPGITEEDYINSESEEKDLMEKFRAKAVIASPVVFLAVAGQVLDGIATYIGIEYFGYSEKHVLSAKLIEIFGNTAGFTIIKIFLAAVICYFFTVANFEHRQRHLRLLIGLCFLVVGMAPGLRDVGRLALGV